MITIDCPYPPSVNQLYRSVQGRSVLSKVGRAYYENGLWPVKVQYRGKPIQDRVAVHIDFHPASHRKTDIDNRAKACLDLLTKAGVLDDDSQVDVLTIVRQEVVKGGKCVVSIERIHEVAA